MSRVVVKVGGSLLDLPDLVPRLTRYVAALPDAGALLVVGGGPAVDDLRARHRAGRLGDDDAHWQAIAHMTANARAIAARLDAPLLGRRDLVREADGAVAVLDADAMLREDERRGGVPLPRTWAVTSDAIAARLATIVGASSLVLLKSCAVRTDAGIEQAACEGVIDDHLPHLTANLDVSLVNFRLRPPVTCCRWARSRA